VHELGHLLGGRHADMGAMGGGGDSGHGATFKVYSGYSLRRFMLLQDLGPGNPKPEGK
jgi:hypothetical protein